jgi:hypothetical protein
MGCHIANAQLIHPTSIRQHLCRYKIRKYVLDEIHLMNSFNFLLSATISNSNIAKAPPIGGGATSTDPTRGGTNLFFMACLLFGSLGSSSITSDGDGAQGKKNQYTKNFGGHRKT